MISARAANNIQSVDILTVGASALVKNQYDASKNPQGIINMGVAENKLMAEELTSKISITLNPSDLSYGSFAGSRDLRKQIAGLMNRRLKLDSEHALTDSQVVVGNGAGSMVSCIAQILADPYDAVLIPAPVYGAFNKDLYYTALVKPVYVNAKDALPSVDMLEEAFAVTQNVKALLITNPGNPTGRLVPRDLLRAWIAWANEKKIHCIVDEVYMLSVWSGAEFTSVLAMDLDLVDPARTHVIWSFSKDFGLNGLRVGAIISRNNSVIQGYKELAYFHAVPTSLDNALAGFLSDEDFVDSFVATNHSRMREIFDTAQHLLTQKGVPFLAPDAGFFIWADFSRFINHPAITSESEAKQLAPGMVLFYRFLAHGVYIVPAQAFFCDSSDLDNIGRFRLNIPIEPDTLHEGMNRIFSVLDSL